MKYYLDTNTCVDYLRGEHLRLLERLLSRRPDEIAIPSIVKAELLCGARKSRQREKNEQMVR